MRIAYLGLGSNLGDREQNLREALQRLAAEDIEVVCRSSVYETEPQYLRSQPWFLNLVVEARVALFPIQLLHRAQKIEAEMGRKHMVVNGPRIIDIDILLFGNFRVATNTLQIPHPRLAERRFVLAPLVEIAPELRHPATRQSMRELLAGVAGQVVRKTGIVL